MTEIIILKHGNLEARLLFCNRAYRNARAEVGTDLYNIDDFKRSVKSIDFLSSYLYQSYLAACKQEKQPVLFQEITFDEALFKTNVIEAESNFPEVIEKAMESISPEITSEVEEIKKKVTEMSGQNLATTS